MPKTPTVLEGSRAPHDARPPEDTRRTAGLQPVPDDKIVFQSRFLSYRLQLTNPQDIILPDGRRIPGKPLRAQFTDGMLTLTREKKADKEIIALIMEHPDLDIDFWNFQKVLANVVDSPELWKDYCHTIFNLKEFIHLL